MNIAELVAVGIGAGVVLAVATKSIGVWGWLDRVWKEETPAPQSDFRPIPMKFVRIPPPRGDEGGKGAPRLRRY